jgi:S-adenosylmethionine decarboxylase
MQKWGEGMLLEEKLLQPKSKIQILEKDYFKCVDGVEYAGTHLILDIWGAKNLSNQKHMEDIFRDCIYSSGATLLYIHFHSFESSGGISGVAILAESHISVHTWPEKDYAAFDIFMCGNTKPEKSIEIIIASFSPSHHKITTMLRGIIDVGGTE